MKRSQLMVLSGLLSFSESDILILHCAGAMERRLE